MLFCYKFVSFYIVFINNYIMKSRKVKAYMARKKPKADLTLDESDSDVNQDSLFHDEIDDFNNEKDDELSTDDELIQHRQESSDEEEVLPITDDEKDESDDNDDDNDDDLEKEDSEEDERDLPNRDAWGKKKSAYYSADFVDEDRGRTYREEDAEAARAEAEEALAIQKSVYSNISADNLGANLFLEGSGDESSGEEEKVDILSATKEEKLKYLRTETQILEVSKEFKSAIQELKKFSRLVNLIETNKIKSEEFEKYIRTKNGVLSLYCLNLCLYMTFASSGKNLKYHPVVQRISSYKQLLDVLKPTDSVAEPIIKKILEKEDCGEEIEFCSESEEEENLDDSVTSSVPKNSTEVTNGEKRKKVPKVKHIDTETEKEIMSFISEVRNETKKRKHEEILEDEEKLEDETEAPANQDENTDEKRIISYKIAKNKGLVPHRKKEYRNPRVHHRMKYRKAQIRRKGQVRGVYKEIKRYEGERTGINSNVIKSVKFK